VRPAKSRFNVSTETALISGALRLGAICIFVGHSNQSSFQGALCLVVSQLRQFFTQTSLPDRNVFHSPKCKGSTTSQKIQHMSSHFQRVDQSSLWHFCCNRIGERRRREINIHFYDRGSALPTIICSIEAIEVVREFICKRVGII
jgi:hypothetical protein